MEESDNPYPLPLNEAQREYLIGLLSGEIDRLAPDV